MNNPFDYTPSAQMLQEQHRLVAHIESMCQGDNAFREDVERGKMFGILRCRSKKSGEEQVLWAFSGQIGGRFHWDGFVPAVFDYLDETGYFKVHEREISAMNREIDRLENSAELMSAREKMTTVQADAEADITAYKQKIKEAKELRDKRRVTSSVLPEGERIVDEAELIRESQFMKAELHRKKVFWRSQQEEAQAVVDEILGDIRLLKLQRQQKSDHLQRWLFEQFVFTRPDGTTISLLKIFQNYNFAFSPFTSGDGVGERLLNGSILPPSGSGECCEPKLLNYAYSHGLEPVEIGMFWWGESPRMEVRKHLHFYPACNGKCKPVLIELERESRGERREESGERMALCSDGLYKREASFGLPSTPLSPLSTLLSPLYEDSHLLVVDKPSGLLSVPGKTGEESVYSLLRRSHPDCPELAMVHRLDMDTSGLLVVAKTKMAHELLQKQFLTREVRKTYIAILEREISGEGRVGLPLRPDIDDRPRQLVDPDYGKPAVTEWRSLGGHRVELHPLTGRTHQLRVHCAHHLGLGNPIKGDRLYGIKGDRLYLHAAELTFRHPLTGETMHFHADLDSSWDVL